MCRAAKRGAADAAGPEATLTGAIVPPATSLELLLEDPVPRLGRIHLVRQAPLRHRPGRPVLLAKREGLLEERQGVRPLALPVGLQGLGVGLQRPLMIGVEGDAGLTDQLVN